MKIKQKLSLQEELKIYEGFLKDALDCNDKSSAIYYKDMVQYLKNKIKKYTE